MTIELIEKNDQGMIRIDLKSIMNQIITPFSNISSQYTEEFIYTGEEKIPFKEKHPVFQVLMLGEFGDY